MSKHIAIGIGSLVLALATGAQAAVTHNSYQVRGNTAMASYSAYDGCAETSVFVYAAEQVARDGGPPSTTAWGYAYAYRVNFCTGESADGFATVDPAHLTLNGVISAALSVTIDLTTTTCTYDEATGEYSCATTDLGVAALTVSLKGSGDTYRGNSMQSFHGGPFHAVSHSTGAYRAADVAMSLTLNGADLLADAVGGWGELDQAASGSTSIDRY